MDDAPLPRVFTITEVSQLAGVSTSTLRHFERVGLLNPSGRISGRRVFDENGLRQLAEVIFWQDAGFALKEIAWLLHERDGDMKEMKQVAAIRMRELNATIARAQEVQVYLSHVLSCAHPRAEECPFYRGMREESAERIARGEHRRKPLLRLLHSSGITDE